MKPLSKLKLFFVACAFCSCANSYDWLYKQYGYHHFYKPEIVAGYPFVHSLILHLYHNQDAFVRGILSLIKESQYCSVALESLLNVEEALQYEWIHTGLIDALKESLYPDKWWMR